MNLTSEQRPNNQKLAITAAYYLTFITLGLTIGAAGPVLPILAHNTGTTLDGISIIFVTNSLGYMAGTWLTGRLFDYFSGHTLLAVALVVVSAMLFILPIAPQLWLLALVMAVIGIFQGTLDVSSNTSLIWLHGAKVGPFLNGLHFFFGVGALIAPIVVAQFTGQGGDIRWVYWLFALVNLPIALWIWFLPAPRAPEHSNPGETPRGPIPLPIMALLMTFFFLYVGLEGGYGSWIFTYATTLHLADATQAAYLTSTYWGAFTLFRLAGVWISTRLSPGKNLIVNFCGAGVGLALILLAPASQTALWIGTIVVGASIASTFPTMLTLADQRLRLTGALTSWCYFGAGIGHMLLPWLIGQIFVPLGARSMMVFIMIDLLLNALILALLLARTRGKLANNTSPAAN